MKKNLLLTLVYAAAVMAATNEPPAPKVPPLAENLDVPAAHPMPTGPTNQPAATNGPIPLQTTHEKLEEKGPTFADGVRLGVRAARRNVDLDDLDAFLQLAVLYWNQEQRMRKQAAGNR